MASEEVVGSNSTNTTPIAWVRAFTPDLRERLLITYGYMQGLNGKVIGERGGYLGGVHTLHIPESVMAPLDELLFGPQAGSIPKDKVEVSMAGINRC